METINVILVDELDNEIGSEEKIKAHKKGLLHRAFSIFIFNKKGELLLQQRAKSKYHSGGLLTNTVCSHPLPNENISDAVTRRLKEEMRFDTELKEIFSFIYKSEYENGLTEYEFDHVFIGYYNSNPIPNIEEVENYKWVTMEYLKKDIEENQTKYTTWFKKILENKDFLKIINNNINQCQKI